MPELPGLRSSLSFRRAVRTTARGVALSDRAACASQSGLSERLRRVMLDWAFSDVNRIGMLVRGAKLYKASGAQQVLRKSGLLNRIGATDADQHDPGCRRSRSSVPGKEAWRSCGSETRNCSAAASWAQFSPTPIAPLAV